MISIPRPWHAAVALLAAFAGCTPRPAPAPPAPGEVVVLQSRTGSAVTLSELAGALRDVDVLLFGEEHDDAGAHRAQLRLLQLLAEGDRPVVLALESLERDVQPLLDRYLRGDIAEGRFLAGARAWPNYSEAYRPLVELARERGWPVVASNAPRALAAEIARGGAGVLERLEPERRAGVAAEVLCPRDAYFQRFAREMRGHGGGAMDTAMVQRFFHAQCAKDETMAESIARGLAAHPGALVLHVQGAFHSDFGQGIVPRLRRRAPGARIRTLSAVSAGRQGAGVAEHRERADYLLFTGDE